jgi:hypothetical protein
MKSYPNATDVHQTGIKKVGQKAGAKIAILEHKWRAWVYIAQW